LFLGQFLKLDRDKLQEAIADHEEQSFSDAPVDKISSYQLQYLLKIVSLCKKKNVELILIVTPIYNSRKYASMDRLWAYYNKYLQGIRYLDFSEYPMPDFGYGDIFHLNYKGAEIFSRYLEDKYSEFFF
jgi:hypothetical protein